MTMEAPHETEPLLRTGEYDNTPVYPIIMMIRADVMVYVDTPLTYEALSAPDLTYTLVRPLVEKYVAIQNEGNLSVVFCCLINMVHFVRDDNISTATLSKSRAHLCEILATRIFRENAQKGMLQLATVLTTAWPVYNGADPFIVAQAREERDDDLEERVGNAIEMAILGKAKKFIRASACQKVVESIWSGKCVYQAESSHSILSDTYKRTPIHFYNPHKAPLLDHYRLKVPSIRSVLEYFNFIVLFILFVIALEYNETSRLNMAEIIFMFFGLGFSLEKVAAMQEHGIKVYFKGTWNGFDLAFITTFAIYSTLRLYGVYHANEWACSLGVDVLALIACLMFPRLAFVTFQDNLLVLALRAMLVQFTFLMLIAAFCFCGFLYALWTLSRNGAGYGIGLIAWWMLDLWFGLDASGFDRASQFHPVFGPALMVTYACLSNTLLLTVLVSILSNTFSSVNENAETEACFRRAVLTIDGVKADSLFSYQPPVNLIALCIMLPASYVLSPRWFHKVNVFMIRSTSFPILLAISLHERYSKKVGSSSFRETLSIVAENVMDTLPRSLKRMTFFEGLAGADADIDAVFEIGSAYDSALDPNDGTEAVSVTTHRRFSESSARRGRTIAGSPPKGPLVRPRINSLIPKPFEAQSFSPLAQVFNPVIVDEDSEYAASSLDAPSQGQGVNATGVSYGPATRRRLISNAPAAISGVITTSPKRNAGVAVPMKRFASVGEVPSSTSMIARSRSQEPDRPHHRDRPAKVTDIKSPDDLEIESDRVTPPDLSARLHLIEQRQERIESLLRNIADKLSR